MRWRLRSVRTRILLLVLVPVLSLVGIYAFALSTTARDAVNLAKANTVKNTVGNPVAAFMAQVTTERTLAILYMSAPTGANLARLELQETKTNTVITNLRSTLTSSTTSANASPAEKLTIATLLRDAATLPSLRAQLAAQIIPSSRAFTEYNALVQDANRVLSSAVRQQNDATVVSQALAFVRMGQSGDLLAQENTLLTAGLSSGHFTPASLQQFTQLVGARRAYYSLTLPDLDPRYRVYYLRGVSPGALASLTSLENTVMSTRPGTLPQVSPIAWQQAVGSVATGLSSAGMQAGDALTSQANDQSSTTYLRLILLGGLGLLAIVISIALSVWIGRRLVRELSDLRQSALELANERLPNVVTRLAAGEQVDVAEQSAVPAVAATSDEVGQVREAFGTVQRTAVEAAVGQAQLRQGISHIFRNLARRSQSLLHRQLTLLDAMERRARDPQELDDLFRVDHLATRMRRHSESLIILSGEAPARGWRHPVPLVDVLRAAVAEVEDYTRIKVTATTQASLAGPAVGDVIHMIAELAENATIYSPPQTPVSITGSVVGPGLRGGDRGPGARHDQRAAGRDQCPAGQPARVRPFRQRPARPLRRRSACQAAEHPDLPALVALRRDDRHRADPTFAGGSRGGGCGRLVPAGRERLAAARQARHRERARSDRRRRRAAQPARVRRRAVLPARFRPARHPQSPRSRPARPGREAAHPTRSLGPDRGIGPERGVGERPGLAKDQPGQLPREHRLPAAGASGPGNRRRPGRILLGALWRGQRARQRHPGNGRPGGREQPGRGRAAAAGPPGQPGTTAPQQPFPFRTVRRPRDTRRPTAVWAVPTRAVARGDQGHHVGHSAWLGARQVGLRPIWRQRGRHRRVWGRRGGP